MRQNTKERYDASNVVPVVVADAVAVDLSEARQQQSRDVDDDTIPKSLCVAAF